MRDLLEGAKKSRKYGNYTILRVNKSKAASHYECTHQLKLLKEILIVYVVCSSLVSEKKLLLVSDQCVYKW